MKQYKWLLCDTHDEIYLEGDRCPCCYIRELEEARNRLEFERDELCRRLGELEAGIARIAAEARDKGAYTWAIKLEELNDGGGER